MWKRPELQENNKIQSTSCRLPFRSDYYITGRYQVRGCCRQVRDFQIRFDVARRSGGWQLSIQVSIWSALRYWSEFWLIGVICCWRQQETTHGNQKDRMWLPGLSQRDYGRFRGAIHERRWGVRGLCAADETIQCVLSRMIRSCLLTQSKYQNRTIWQSYWNTSGRTNLPERYQSCNVNRGWTVLGSNVFFWSRYRLHSLFLGKPSLPVPRETGNLTLRSTFLKA